MFVIEWVRGGRFGMGLNFELRIRFYLCSPIIGGLSTERVGYMLSLDFLFFCGFQ